MFKFVVVILAVFGVFLVSAPAEAGNRHNGYSNVSISYGSGGYYNRSGYGYANNYHRPSYNDRQFRRYNSYRNNSYYQPQYRGYYRGNDRGYYQNQYRSRAYYNNGYNRPHRRYYRNRY